ncbi:hypothetical protein [Lyngbya aestuarii]
MTKFDKLGNYLATRVIATAVGTIVVRRRWSEPLSSRAIGLKR